VLVVIFFLFIALCACNPIQVKLGVRIAQAGYYLSLPSAVERVESFQKLAQALPMDKILTETGKNIS
jgi:Tat protein secretion system quality control protein TatD with DNase activity